MDEQLAGMICGSGAERNEALRYVYLHWRNPAKAMLLAAGSQAADAEDAIQEAVIVLDNHLRNFRFQKKGSLKNYFLGICRGRWLSNQRSLKRLRWTDDPLQMDGVEAHEPETLMLEKEQKDLVRQMLSLLDEKCRELLRLYRLSYSMQEISEEMDLGGENNARQRVFQCRKRLRELAGKRPGWAAYFKA